jgi:hypothetical protein
MQVSASWAGAWWILVFVGALVLAAQVPPRQRPAEVKQEHNHRRREGSR